MTANAVLYALESQARALDRLADTTERLTNALGAFAAAVAVTTPADAVDPVTRAGLDAFVQALDEA